MFAYDPHLDPLLPSNWFLNEISWENHSVIGATTVGFPLISSGQSLNLSWGVTTSYVDGSDAWEEELNQDKTKYLVDGEWRDIIKRKEIIPVKGQKDVEVELFYTHRGILMDFESIRKTIRKTYGTIIPKMQSNSFYSIA